MADVNRILQVQMVSDRLQIVGIMVEIVTIAYLRRTAVAPSVMGDDAIAVSEENSICVSQSSALTTANHG